MCHRSFDVKSILTLMYGVCVRRCTSPYFGAWVECARPTVKAPLAPSWMFDSSQTAPRRPVERGRRLAWAIGVLAPKGA